MEVTKAFGGGCLIGVPIVFKDGRKFGTLCGMDNKPYSFTDKDVQLFARLANLITYILEVDHSYQQILTLSAPIVPICKGVAILTLIGKIDDKRSQEIIKITMQECSSLSLDHLVVDVSGVNEIDETQIKCILELVNLLKLIGVEAIFTGMRPEIAQKAILIHGDFKDMVFRGTLESGLSSIGIKYVKHDKQA